MAKTILPYLLVFAVLAFASADADVDASTVVPETDLTEALPKTTVTAAATPLEPLQEPPQDQSQRSPDPVQNSNTLHSPPLVCRK